MALADMLKLPVLDDTDKEEPAAALEDGELEEGELAAALTDLPDEPLFASLEGSRAPLGPLLAPSRDEPLLPTELILTDAVLKASGGDDVFEKLDNLEKETMEILNNAASFDSAAPVIAELENLENMRMQEIVASVTAAFDSARVVLRTPVAGVHNVAREVPPNVPSLVTTKLDELQKETMEILSKQTLFHKGGFAMARLRSSVETSFKMTRDVLRVSLQLPEKMATGKRKFEDAFKHNVDSSAVPV